MIVVVQAVMDKDSKPRVCCCIASVLLIFSGSALSLECVGSIRERLGEGGSGQDV